jgi:hypothetical protein
MNKRSVKAFTIMEVTIAMLLASVVIGLTYATYNIVSKSYSLYNVKNDKLAELVRLDELIRRDFDKAATVERTANGFEMRSLNKLVTYGMENEFVIRKSVVVDTFKVNVQGMSTSFEGMNISEPFNDDKQNRIDELELILFYDDKKIPYHYHKQYSSVNLMQRYTDALN